MKSVSVLCMILWGMILCSPASGQTRHQVTGLFMPEREKDLREVVDKISEIKLVSIDFQYAEVAFDYDVAKFGKPDQAIQKLDSLLRSASSSTFGVKPLSTVPKDKLKRIEINVAGLDCKACSLAAYEAIYKLDGVERATASFKDNRVTALVDPAKTDRQTLESALKKRGVHVVEQPKKEIIGTIERLDPRFDKLIPKDAQLEKIADGFIWTEGAVWYKPGKCLLFSDIPNNVVVKWEPGKGTSEFLKPSGYTGKKARGGRAGDEPGSNGLFLDAQGRLYLCEHGDRRVTRIEKDGKKTVLADKYMGKRLNSPNDLALHPNGDVYFTDPPYGLAKGDTRELDFTGVYRISGKDGSISLVSKDLKPNGIALSPDHKKLYVTNAGTWMVFPVNDDGSTGEGKLFASPKQWKLAPAKGGGVDGMKCDAHGNLFATGPGGVCVIAPDGTLLGRFLTGDRTANLCFGGEDGQTLFVCVNHRIGMVRTTTKGIGW